MGNKSILTARKEALIECFYQLKSMKASLGTEVFGQTVSGLLVAYLLILQQHSQHNTTILTLSLFSAVAQWKQKTQPVHSW